jgi:8-oxo-dGTP pyrophosphatase MutT (NUDIX family)
MHWRGGDDYEDIGFSESGRWGNAGSGILFTTGDRILLLKRSPEVEEPRTWGIPGGAVPQTRDGDFMDAYESAKRETQEEIGTLPAHNCIDEYVYEEEGFRYTTFICEVTEDEAEALRPVFNWENEDYAWVNLDELGDYDLHFGVLELLNHVNPFL